MKKGKRNKENKSLEILKKGFKKNEIVIYAITLMLVTAGYFNYTANTDKSVETYSENIATSNNEVKKSSNNTNSTKQNNETNSTKISETVNTNLSKENTVTVSKNIEEEKKDDDNIGDAKLVNSNSVVKEDKKTDENSDYYISTKLQRDTNYADMISTYTKILEDGSISETQKAIAMKEITKITDTKNAISVCENILSTKGFKNYLILVNNDSVNVVVKVDGGLNKAKVAQIQNIVSREFKSKIEDIHITEK